MKLAPFTKLHVSLDWGEADTQRVGTLLGRNQKSHFEFSPAFLNTQLEISPFKLPRAPGVHIAPPHPFEGLFGLFHDSLPDGWGRLLLDRQARRQGIAPRTLTSTDRLAAIGARGIGALIYEPDLSEPPSPLLLDLDELADRSRKVLDGPPDTILPLLLRLGGSPQGARPKALIAVSLDGERIVDGTRDVAPELEPMLVKFAARGDGVDAGAVEFVYHQMAAQCGIDVPTTRLLPSDSGPGWFASRRFDRIDHGRLHVQTLAGLLHADHRLPSMDYAGALQATLLLTGDLRAVEEFYRRAVFNVFTHNRDDHTKQFSFTMDRRGEWKLAPAYDLTFSDGPGGEHSMSIVGEGRVPETSHLIELAARAGLSKNVALTSIRRTHDALASWNNLAKNAGVRESTRQKIASRFPCK